MTIREAALSIIEDAERKLWRCDKCGERCGVVAEYYRVDTDYAYGIPDSETLVTLASDCCGAPVEEERSDAD